MKQGQLLALVILKAVLEYPCLGVGLANPKHIVQFLVAYKSLVFLFGTILNHFKDKRPDLQGHPLFLCKSSGLVLHLPVDFKVNGGLLFASADAKFFASVDVCVKTLAHVCLLRKISVKLGNSRDINNRLNV